MADYSTRELRALGRELAGLRKRIDSATTTQQLGTSSIENGGALVVKDPAGNEVLQVGGQWDGSFTASPLTGPKPPTPTKPVVTGVQGGLNVQWDGLFVDSAFAPMDFSRVEVHVGTTAGFNAQGATTLKGTIETPRGTQVAVLDLPVATYYVKLVARSTPGLAGDASEEVAAASLAAADSAAVQQALDTASEALVAAQDAQATADGRVVTYFQNDPPADASEGDLWFDMNDGNLMHRWNSSTSTWDIAQDQVAAEALTAATNAQAIADSKIVTYWQAAAPPGGSVGDLWIDTDDGNKMHRHDGANWVSIQDGAIADARVIADEAIQLAGDKGKIYSQSTPPSSASTPPPVNGDLWFNPTSGTLYQFNNNVWDIPRLDARDNLMAGTITASLLASQIVLTTTVVAGPLNDSHAEMSPAGLRLFKKGPDGDVQLSSSLGSMTDDDFFQVYSSTDGMVVASIDQNGGIVSRTASLGRNPGDVEINGAPFESYFTDYTSGLTAWGARTTQGPATSTSGESKWLEVQTVLQKGRIYRVTVDPLYAVPSTSNTAGVMLLRCATDGAAATVSSTQIQGSRFWLPVVDAWTTPQLVAIVNTGTQNAQTREYRFLATYRSYSGGTVYLTAAAGYPSIMTVQDLGPSIPNVGIDFGNPSPPVVKQNYTTYWYSSGSASYTGSGTKRTDTSDMVHGTDPSGFNGNGCAVALFMGNSYSSTNSGEIGKTLWTALDGATINSVEFMFTNRHWYYNAGGSLYYLPGYLTSLPSSIANPSNNYYSYTPFSYGQAKYVPATKNTYTSVIIGQAPGGISNYGRFAGATQSGAPVMKVNYTR